MVDSNRNRVHKKVIIIDNKIKILDNNLLSLHQDVIDEFNKLNKTITQLFDDDTQEAVIKPEADITQDDVIKPEADIKPESEVTQDDVIKPESTQDDVINSNMTIIDVISNDILLKIIEPFIFEIHLSDGSSKSANIYLHNNINICSIDYFRKNLYNSKIIDVEYQAVKHENKIMLKLPENTYCYSKDNPNLEYIITTNTQRHPCKEIEFKNIYKWCNIPLLFEQLIEFLKAREIKNIPNDVISDISFLRFEEYGSPNEK